MGSTLGTKLGVKRTFTEARRDALSRLHALLAGAVIAQTQSKVYRCPAIANSRLLRRRQQRLL